MFGCQAINRTHPESQMLLEQALQQLRITQPPSLGREKHVRDFLSSFSTARGWRDKVTKRVC